MRVDSSSFSEAHTVLIISSRVRTDDLFSKNNLSNSNSLGDKLMDSLSFRTSWSLTF